jgi:enolase
MNQAKIVGVRGRQILDSRGRPTVEVDINLNGGASGRASVPSGASTGSAEAYELRDANPEDYAGLGVSKAVGHVNGEIAKVLLGADALDQQGVDARLLALDGTAQLRRLGANAILGCSLAVARAAAAARNVALYEYIQTLAGNGPLSLPMPMVNILSGGLHAGRGMDVQDFLAIPSSATSMAQAIKNVARIRAAAGEILAGRGLSTLLADEGGLSPGFQTSREALQLMVDATEKAGLRPGVDMSIAIDVAATALFDKSTGDYHLRREGRHASRAEMIAMVEGWISEFPVVSVEDALDEEDWQGWQQLTRQVGSRVRLIGDDFFTTNRDRLARGIREHCANGVLVKLNQNGTLSGTLQVIADAQNNGYSPVVSARSGETEDPFIADLAVGTSAGQIKIGSVRCSDRLAKYNQLLRIEEHCGAAFAGMTSVLLN